VFTQLFKPVVNRIHPVTVEKVHHLIQRSGASPIELSPIFGDGRAGQAAAVAG
jgi:hypothetical protein